MSHARDCRSPKRCSSHLVEVVHARVLLAKRDGIPSALAKLLAGRRSEQWRRYTKALLSDRAGVLAARGGVGTIDEFYPGYDVPPLV